MPAEDQITVEILLRPSEASRGGGARPDPGAVERVRRAMAARGARCHATPFAVVCSAPRALFAKVLGPAASSAGPGASLPVPPELAGDVEQITVAVQPEFFP